MRTTILLLCFLCLLLCACGSSGSSQNSASDAVTATISDSTSTAQLEPFLLKSDAGIDGGMLPVQYTCDGAGSSPALSWLNVPTGTKEFAIMMKTLPGDGTTKWNWVVYGIPATVSSLPKNNSIIGMTGTGSHGTTMVYDGPCSQGPGAKLYTFTIYALSESPSLPATADLVTGPVLSSAISSITLGSATLNMSYARP